MARKKKPRDDAKLAKTSSPPKRGKRSRRDPQTSAFDVLSRLADLPQDVRRQLLASIVGDEAAVEMFELMSDEMTGESDGATPAERLLRRADAAATPEECRQRLQELVEQEPDCVEAWTQLAESQDHIEEAIPIHEQAVAAAERALPEHLRTGELDHHDEGVRTYIWALRDLMECLKAAHRLDEAIAVGEQILRREPEDHTATRYELLGLLLETGKREDVQALLQAYIEEPSAVWTFGRLLLAIQNRDDEDELARLLQQAHKSNPFVIDYLLDRRPAPIEMPGLIELKGDSGAVLCVIHLRKAWASTPGAISWLRGAAGKAGLLQPVPDKELLSLDIGELLGLDDPQSPRSLPPHPAPVWIAGTYEMRAVHRPGRKRPKKVWALYALAESGPVNLDILEERPNASDLWEWLLETMHDRDIPGRPERIEFPQKGICGQLRIKATRAGMQIDVCQEPPALAQIFEKLAEQLDWEGRGEAVSDEDILALPQDPTDVWQCDLAELEERLIDDQGELRRASSVLVVSQRDELVLGQQIRVQNPDDRTLLGALQQAMMMPMAGDRRRPADVVVRHTHDRLLLEPTLEKWQIGIRVKSQLDVLDRVRQELSTVSSRRSTHCLHNDPEITREDRSAFYEAACRFYRERPWQQWLEDDLIEITSEAIGPAPVYALIMGQSGIETGLSLFDDRTIPQRLFQGDGAAAMREIAGFSLNFDEEQSVPVLDLNDIEQFGWPIATPEAYPVPLRIDKGPSFSAVTRAQLQMLTAVMEAILALSRTTPEPVVVQSGDVSVTCRYAGRVR